MIRSTLRLAAFLTICLGFLQQSHAQLVANFDNDSGDGSWETATNWDGDVVPTGGFWNPDGTPPNGGVHSGAQVFINDGSTVSLATNQPLSDSLHDVGVGVGASGVGTLNHSAGSINTTEGWFWVGHDTGTGTYSMTDSAAVVSVHSGGAGVLLVGSGGGNGTMTMADNSYLQADGLKLATDGTDGVANFTMSGSASVVLAGDLDIVNGDNGVATANINGGSLTANAIFVNRGGAAGSATVNQTAGTVISNNWIAIGAAGDGTAADYNISGGQSISNGDWYTVGENGVGTLNASGSADIQANGLGMVLGRNDNGAGTFSIDGSNVSIIANSLLVDFNVDLVTDPVGASGTLDFTADANGVSVIQSFGDVIFGDNALLTVDLSAAPLSGDVPLINVGTTLTGTFAGLPEGAVVPNSSGRTITYTYGDGNDIALIGGGVVSQLACDFEPDMDCDIDDIDALYAVFGAAGGNGQFDFDADGDVDADDINSWLTAASVPANQALLSPTHQLVLGDIDFDGDVDSSDLGLLLNNFNSTSGVGWGGGDLNADQNVNSSDLGLLLNNFNFTSAAAASAVPEPESLALLMVAFSCLLMRHRRVRIHA